jgi:dolichol-phosphate mannosyltransferase
MTSVVIAIPILNERKNICSLLRKIFSVNKYFSILYIDDSSEDGSQKLIKKLQYTKKNIFLISRSKRLGIGSAHKEAIDWSCNNNYDFLITIDGDFTHNPIYIKDILKALNVYDVVNTSRFLKDNSLRKWSLVRVIITKIRYYLVKFLLKSKLDSSSGFRGYSLKKIKKEHLFLSLNDSYFFLIESLIFLERLNYKIFEIHNNLNPRKAGVSKMNIKHFFNAISSLIKLYFKIRFKR